jgi:predicted ATPase
MVENYRAFKGRATIELRPLTVFFGYNSAGKSALLRALPLLSDSLKRNSGAPIHLGSEAARGARFEDLVCNFTSSSTLKFGFGWRTGELGHVEYSIVSLADRRTRIVSELVLTSGSGDQIRFEWLADTSSTGALSNLYQVTDTKTSSVIELQFGGLRASLGPQLPSDSPMRGMFDALDKQLQDTTNVHWLTALRHVPPRFDALRGKPDTLRPDGAGADQLLAYDELTDGRIFDDVSRWYEHATGHSLTSVKGAFSGRELFSLSISASGVRGAGVDMIDTGEGMAQVLPVICLLASAKHGALGKNPILAIEHPELHLHPAIHSELSRLFCESARNSDALSVVETHSENFLLRMQLEIAEGTLPPEKVAVYWITTSPSGGAVVDKVEFDDLGRPIGDRWPPGVFDENINQAKAIALARRSRTSRA